MKMHKNLWALGALGTAAMLAAAPATAASSASATITGITITLIDLNSGDGIDAALSWSWEQSYSGAQVYSSSESDYDSDWGASFYASTSAMAGLPFGSASASTGPGGGSAAGSVSGPSYGGYGYFYAWGSPVYGGFSVTPWTGIIVTATFDGMAKTTVGLDEYAWAQGYLSIEIPADSGYDYYTSYRYAYAGCGWDGTSCVGESASFSGSMKLTYANLSDDAVDGTMYARAYADGYSSAPIPEPQTYLMLLAGLAGVGAVVGRRRRIG